MAIITGSEILMAWQDFDLLKAKKISVPDIPRGDENT
jgi:hypothetical protein